MSEKTKGSGDGKPRMTTEEIMSILTESQKNEIKRNIGNVFRKVLLQAEVKLILVKQPINRTEREIDRVVFFLKTSQFLSRDKNL